MTTEEIINKRIVMHGVTGSATLRLTWCAISDTVALNDVKTALSSISAIQVNSVRIVNRSKTFECTKDGTPYTDFTIDADIETTSDDLCLRTGVVQTALEVYHRHLYNY